MQGMPEPHTMQKIPGRLPGRSRGIESRPDALLQSRLDRLQPFLPLQYFVDHVSMLRARAVRFRATAYHRSVLNRVHRLQVETRGKGLYEFTDSVARWLSMQ